MKPTGYNGPIRWNVGAVEFRPKVEEQQSLLKTVQLVGHAAYAESIRSTANNRSTSVREDMIDVERKTKKRAYHQFLER
jgi:hypothetical protein